MGTVVVTSAQALLVHDLVVVVSYLATYCSIEQVWPQGDVLNSSGVPYWIDLHI